MSNYVSYETRKVIEAVEEYGILLSPADHFDIEVAVAKFWNTHIQQIVEQVMKPSSKTSAEQKVERASADGWNYFDRVVWNMLPGRGAAHRTDGWDVEPDSRRVYNAVRNGILLADFNMKELRLLTVDIPSITTDVGALSNAFDACRRQGNRNVYYLHGILKREADMARGKLAERAAAEEGQKAWEPPPEFEKLDIGERAELLNDWQERLNSIKINQALNAATSRLR